MKVRAAFISLFFLLSLFVMAPMENTEADSGSENIVINEIMYDPLGTDSQKEWIELYNNGSTSVNITDWVLSDQDGPDDFIFPQLSFPPGSYIVIHTGDGVNETDFSDGTSNLYMFDSGTFLENTGDDILLVNSTGGSVDYVAFDFGGYVDPCPVELTWDDANPWSFEGNSISLHPNGWDMDSGYDWEESDPTQGAPNAHLDDDPPVILDVRHTPQNPLTSESVEIITNVSDDYFLDSVILNFSIDGIWQPYGYMIYNGGNYSFTLPALGEGTVIVYMIAAVDDAQKISFSQVCSFAYSDLASQVVINEILANPESDWNADDYFDSDDEWIELYNKGSMPVNIGGWIIDDKLGPTGSSDPYVIPKGHFIGPFEFRVYFGSETGVVFNDFGEENATLLDDLGNVVDIYYYDMTSDDTAMGRYPDGSDIWKDFLLPTPGDENQYTADSLSNLLNVKINEFLPTPKSLYSKEWIELYNSGSSPVRLDGCYLDDIQNSGTKPWRIPLNTTLGPGNVVVFTRTFGLNNAGDIVNLFSVDGSTILDSYSYGSSEYDVSFGRGGDGGNNWVSFSNPTPGGANLPYDLPDANDGGVLFSRLFYHGSEETEFLCLYNPSGSVVDLGGWRIADSEHSYSGTVIFPQGVVMDSKSHLYVANNALIFYDIMGFFPDLEYGNSTSSVPDLTGGQTPSFAMQQDEIRLLTEIGSVIDIVAYGDSEYEGWGWTGPPVPDASKGEFLIRNFDDGSGTYSDTNTSSDWKHMRHYKPGQSDFEFMTFSYNGSITVFASPDSSYETIINAIDSASDSILIGLYEFSNWNLSKKIIEKLEVGVDVKILMEGSPVGGFTDDQKYVLQKIHENGGEVRFLVANSTLGSRYNFIHAKYAVIDNSSVIISSENWKYTGIPVDNTYGNRGWGVVIGDLATSQYFADVFYSDWGSVNYDIFPFTPKDKNYGNASSGFGVDDMVVSGYYDPVFPSKTFSGEFSVSPVISPDTSLSEYEGILGIINAATESIYVEQLDFALNWDEGETVYENPFLWAVVEAAEERQVNVKILLSQRYSYFNNTKLDNYDTYNYINELAEERNITEYLEARLVNYNRLGLSKLHNKGMIVDGEKTLISSINWNRNSAAQNREVGVIIENEEVAEYFTELFFWDYNEPPLAGCGGDITWEATRELLFNSSSSDPDGNIISYFWDFDDGTNSTESDPVHIFEDEGIYNVKLTVYDGQYWDSDSITVIVEKPKAAEEDLSNFVYGTLLFIFIVIFIIIIAFIRQMKYKFL
jgi:PKD repeat protein